MKYKGYVKIEQLEPRSAWFYSEWNFIGGTTYATLGRYRGFRIFGHEFEEFTWLSRSEVL